jgi:hypothetical protein
VFVAAENDIVAAGSAKEVVPATAAPQYVVSVTAREVVPVGPLKVSGPLVPISLTAKATPLAPASVKAIAASSSTGCAS